MKKIKLDNFELKVIIKSLNEMRTQLLNQKEVADKLSISQSYISRIEKKVIKKLKTLLRFS